MDLYEIRFQPPEPATASRNRMMNLDMTNTQKIHTRHIQCATYKCSPDTFIVEGVLKDDRLAESYGPFGKLRPPGTVHHMIIRMQVKGPELVIEDIEVEMPTLPNEFCIETIKCLEPIKGMRIASGFTSRVKNLVGGVKGCVHLVAGCIQRNGNENKR